MSFFFLGNCSMRCSTSCIHAVVACPQFGRTAKLDGLSARRVRGMEAPNQERNNSRAA